jgi:hypothetical protein
MNNIPPKLRNELSKKPFYNKCERGRLGFTSECEGRITWEHAIYYAGKQVQEEWAIIPLCEYHHSVGKWQNNGGINKRLNEWIALSRLFDLEEGEFNKMQKKYPKAIMEWRRKLIFLKKVYGKYKQAPEERC